jgi:glycosyltransferase
MHISVVTAVYNRRGTIAGAIQSVASQTCDLEYVVIDGMSSDGTSEVINQHASCIDNSIREKDGGIYDALNKGVAVSTGDVVGFLHADDLLPDSQAIQRVQEKFHSGDFDAVYGDLMYVDFDNTKKIIRYWNSGEYKRVKFRRGWMPPHPTVYVRKEIYEKFGNYRTDLGSAADYECMIRLLYRHELRVGYIPHVQVKMRVGGESNASFKNRLNANQSDRQAWLENGFKPPFGLRFTKPLSKLPQYWQRPKCTTQKE